jgi:transposase-like protein
MNSSKKGMSFHQMHRMLQVTYKTAWFMTHHIRYAMKTIFPTDDKFSGVVEVDETYVGGKGRGKRGRGSGTKAPVFSLVERNGRVMSTPVDRVTSANLKSIIRQNVDKSTTIMTDDFASYRGLGKEFAQHCIIKHSTGEYVRGDIHTNTIEGYFSLLKRGIIGVYHHVSKHHLHRYLSEFDFRYNRRTFDDTDRSIAALMNIEGKRLQYKDS